MNRVGVCYHPKNDAGRVLAEQLCERLRPQVPQVWMASAWEDVVRAQVAGTDLLFCVGGDGTVLRGARSVVPHGTLLLGVNLGHIGFLAELDASEVMERLPDILACRGRVEERAMLQAFVAAPGGQTVWGGDGEAHVLNDLVVGRASLGRIIQFSVLADGIKVADYRADGVIVATATGSTAYSLALGGPILYPESKEILVSPIAPHLSDRHSVVLPSTAVVEVQVLARAGVTVSVDGEAGPELQPGQVVRARLSSHVTRFLRLGPPSDFYARVAQRLRWVRRPTAEEDRPEEDPPAGNDNAQREQQARGQGRLAGGAGP